MFIFHEFKDEPLRSVEREMKHSIQISFQGFGPSLLQMGELLHRVFEHNRLFSAFLLVNTASLQTLFVTSQKAGMMSQMEN